jgi:hypothetical protein
MLDDKERLVAGGGICDGKLENGLIIVVPFILGDGLFFLEIEVGRGDTAGKQAEGQQEEYKGAIHFQQDQSVLKKEKTNRSAKLQYLFHRNALERGILW